MIDSYFENISKNARKEHPNPRANFVPFGLRIYRVTPQGNYPIFHAYKVICSCQIKPQSCILGLRSRHVTGVTIRIFDRLIVSINRRPKGCKTTF